MVLYEYYTHNIPHSYGREGYIIISTTLEHIFPESDVDLEALAPLTWSAVIHEFLLPEVMILLIQEDLRIPRQACIVALQKSAHSALGPVIKQESDTPGAGADNITPEIIDLCTPPRNAVYIKQEQPEPIILQQPDTHSKKANVIIDLTLSDSDNE